MPLGNLPFREVRRRRLAAGWVEAGATGSHVKFAKRLRRAPARRSYRSIAKLQPAPCAAFSVRPESAPRSSIASDLLAGRLARPFALALEVAYAYWIVGPKATAGLPKISTFRSWLLAEAAEDARRLRRP